MQIKGQRVVLRDDHRDSDSDDFFRWYNMEEWKYYDTPDQPFQPISREEFKELAKKNEEESDKHNKERSKGSSSSRPGSAWHIDTVDGHHIGWVNSYNWNQEEKSVFIGICIPEEENWGKGNGTEAVCLFLNFLYDSFGLHIIRTATWTGNKRMVHCAQKAGFTNPKIMPHRSSTSVRGEPLERIEFSLSSAEWFKINRDGG